MTLVRDDARRLPLHLPADATILAVMPTPTDLTPADTSSHVLPGLARALRVRHANVDELVVPAAPSDADVAAAVATYSILPDSLDALASALFGAIPFAGRLPVTVAGVEVPPEPRQTSST